MGDVENRVVRDALVLGLGVSGVSVALMLAREGARVVAVDEKDGEKIRAAVAPLEQFKLVRGVSALSSSPPSSGERKEVRGLELGYHARFAPSPQPSPRTNGARESADCVCEISQSVSVASGITVMLGEKNLPAGSFDLAVISPGIAIEHRWMAELQERGIPVLPEFELGWSRLRSRTIAVTGTNGKSTAVKWLADSLREAGQSAEPCGNYGKPVCDVAMMEPQPEWAVIEVSSFQLETLKNFRCDAGVLLNLMPNHLDRHPNFHSYAAAKARLFSNSGTEDFCIVPACDLERMRKMSGGAGEWRTFGDGGEFEFRDGAILRGGNEVADLRGSYFDNEVLGVNAAAVVATLDALGVDPSCAARAAKKFVPLSHRMEFIGEKDGVRFINDSKATTLSAVGAALKMCGGRVRLIAGGILKEQPEEGTKELLAARTAGVYLIGAASEELFKAWSDASPCFRCETLEQAVVCALRDARSGDVILLSPGCSSFDQFTGYAQRGEVFRKAAKSLGVG